MIKEKFSRVFIVVVLTMMMTMLSCGGGSNNQANKVSQQELQVTVPDNAVSISPIEFIDDFGNTYRITKYEIKKDEQDKITITASGTGFNRMKFINGNAVFPVQCAYIFDGKEVVAKRVHTGEGGAFITYFFETSDNPEIVIFYPVDDESKKVEINCK